MTYTCSCFLIKKKMGVKSFREVYEHNYPQNMQVSIVHVFCRVTVQLLGIDLWESCCTPQADISKELLIKLQVNTEHVHTSDGSL